jgi:21S rRNA (GM2251-2'-O)-methyltransferase
MSSIVLARRSYGYWAKLFPSNLSSSLSSSHFSSSTLRFASLNSAIGRGLRKSKGVGFRGKERSQERSEGGANDSSRGTDGLVRRTADLSKSIPRGQLTHDAWRKENAPFRQERRDELSSRGSTMRLLRQNWNNGEAPKLPHATSRHDRREESSLTSSTLRLRRGKRDIVENEERPKRRSRAARFNDPNYSFGKRALERRVARMAKGEGQDEEAGLFTRKPRSAGDSKVMGGRRRPTMTSAALRAAESDRTALERNPGGSKLSKGRQAYLTRIAESSQRKTSEENVRRPSSGYLEENQGYTRGNRDSSPASMEGRPNRECRPGRDNEDVRSASPRMVNDRLPLSIPYTTPASEFLYGTSVVEAALRTRREPCRKLYKLYVYQGENRESGGGRDAIERLAKKINVPIVYHTDSPRLLDKMSAGRPHNGYILEASPLPKLPLISLGSLTTDGAPGFMVNLDHQSREEAAINGTSPFIPLPSSPKGQSRKPLVLLLDSILDPGNLGGIIRTASFLGITAIALSTRNSAPLSPVVLKASAGASETITLFSVSKPAGFIADSQRAGWKVYAAVAPRSPPAQGPQGHRPRRSPSLRRPTSPSVPEIPAITTDDLVLDNPLDRDPCILMLGNEGEGLRWNLRGKADVEIAIAGSGAHRDGVDSLNVSVAAGVLCWAFVSRVGGVGGGYSEKETGLVRERHAKRVGEGEGGREGEKEEQGVEALGGGEVVGAGVEERRGGDLF